MPFPSHQPYIPTPLPRVWQVPLAPVLSLCESLQGATPAFGLVSYLTHWIRSPQSQTHTAADHGIANWHKLTWKCTQCYLAVTYKAKNILQKPFAILIAYSSVWDAALWELYYQHKGSFCHFLQGCVLSHRNYSNKSRIKFLCSPYKDIMVEAKFAKMLKTRCKIKSSYYWPEQPVDLL